MSNNAKTPQPKHALAAMNKKASGWSNFGMLWSIFLPPLCFVLFCTLGCSDVNMPEYSINELWAEQPANTKTDNSTHPFKIEFTQVTVNDLKERLLHRGPFKPPLENARFKYGFNTDFLTRVLDFWQNSYNFEERENFLNTYDQYMTNIQGLNIHYIHVRPKVEPNIEVIPLLLIHNWPSSIREYYEMIPLLTHSRSSHNFVFELVIPSLPGTGFSQAPTRAGMGPVAMGVILRNLMERIGHDKYYVHGGDFGHAIGSVMATLFPDHVLGLHSNMPVILNNRASFFALLGSLWPSFIVKPEVQDRLYPLSKHISTLLEESGYFHIQATKPDTIGIALSESPAGLLAYILEKFSYWTNLENREASDGGLLNKFSLTHLLDNVMIYWTTNSITTSMRPFVEYYKDMSIVDKIPTTVPMWGIKFKHEIRFVPDSLLKMKFKNYLRTTVVEDGGHFPAMEHPIILTDDIFEAVTTFRQFHEKKSENEPATKPAPPAKKTVYSYTVKNIHGQEVDLGIYKGKVLIIVNVASQCGYTDTHYTQLNQLYEKYADAGLRILAFPCNQFGGQEPGSLNEIIQFTKQKNVKFDLFEKIEVNGDNTHPLWQFLKDTQKGTIGDFIKWNFSKFIIDRNGVPVERFGPNVSPMDLEPYLEKYW